MEFGTHSGAGAADFVSPFLDVPKQLQLLKQKLKCIPRSTREEFPIATDHMDWDGVKFSWITKGGIELPPADQKRETCWAWALYRGHRYFTAVNGLHGFDPLTYETIINGCPKRHLNINNGIDDNVENAKYYLIDNNHVPLQNYEDAGFEVLIEKLLIKGPVGIYTPNVMECQTTAFEIYSRHIVVITGFGAKKINGEMKGFWEIQDLGGFDCLARGMGLIREAVEFKF